MRFLISKTCVSPLLFFFKRAAAPKRQKLKINHRSVFCFHQYQKTMNFFGISRVNVRLRKIFQKISKIPKDFSEGHIGSENSEKIRSNL